MLLNNDIQNDDDYNNDEDFDDDDAVSKFCSEENKNIFPTIK